MIDIIKQTPFEYSKQSRDYQVLARLYTAIFNLTKMYIDDLNIWTDNIDNKLTYLRASTLNFEPRHLWDEDDLEAITSCFKYLMRYKGATKALEYCVNILMKIEKINGEEIAKPVVFENNNVTIYIPENLLTIGIIEDLVRYLLPSGLTYDIVKYKTSDLRGGLTSTLWYNDDLLEWFEYPYGDNMTIGTSIDESGGGGVTPQPSSDWTKITSEDKIWFGAIIESDEEFIPESETGIDHPTGVYATVVDENNVETQVLINSNLLDVEVDVAQKQKPIDNDKAKYINKTFIYNEKEFTGDN